MKQEAMDILQNELLFDRLSGSAGDITAVSMGEKVRPHSWPFDDESRLSGYLQLASAGRESVPEPVSNPVSVPDLSLELAGISESDSSTLNIECKATPAIPDGFCINARIKVHAYGYDCNPGYKLSCCGKCDDGCHVTFTLQDYRRSFNIGTLDRREVFVRIEYDLVDMQSGFHWTNKKVLSTKVMSNNNTISERFE